MKTGKRVDDNGEERVVGREDNGLQYRRRKENEEGENMDKRIVMIELIIQE
jgi:hypothetical protein